MFVDVSGGDSILLIDGSSRRIVMRKGIGEKSARFSGEPDEMRFGGAAGPIAFERMRRMHNGSWDTITVPMGLALRTSALLEPLASGCVVVDDDSISSAPVEIALRRMPCHPSKSDGALSASDLPISIIMKATRNLFSVRIVLILPITRSSGR
jgi:hypothetical protein